MTSKQDIISNIYYDRAGFGSRAQTLKDSREKDVSITKEDIEEFFKKNVEEKRKMRGENSFIPKEAMWEFQFDLFFINDIPDQKFKVGAIMIDAFYKYMVVIPIKSKSEGDVASALIEGFNKMGGTPKLLYTDDEGALNTKSIQDYLKENNIEHHRTRGHAQYSERGIRTFKDALYKRIEADEKKGKTNILWTEYIFEILLTYNNKNIHSTTKFTPSQAKLPKNEFEVKLNISLQAKRNRTYPEIEVGDSVKIMRKKGISEKERTSHWLRTPQKIKRTDKKLGQNYYYLESDDKRGYLRHELLKV